MRWSIRTQLLSPVLLLLVGVAGISVTTALAAARQARGQVETRLRNVARFLVEASFPLSEPVLVKLQAASGAEYLLRPRSGPALTSLPIDAQQAALEDVPVADDWHEVRLGPPVRLAGQTYLVSAVRLRGQYNAGDTLYILYPESLWRDARWEAIWPSLLLGLSAGLASVALALAQARRLGRRLRELRRLTGRIAGGDFGPVPLPGRDDEIRDLIGSLNEMADRLARLQGAVEQTERLRLLGQVSGGLAHQLRNGLTGARLAVQLHLREAGPGHDVSALEVALRQLSLLETHVRRFLDLGKAPAARARCSLAGVVAEAVDLLRPQCRHSGIELLWAAPASPVVSAGDAGQLAQLAVNLIDNAIDAAGPGGSVEVRLLDGPAAVVLEVWDSGPGPADAVASRLFEPFVTSKPEGVGLGLAVARQVAEGHGGRISWHREGGRTCFRVELPAAEEAGEPPRRQDAKEEKRV